MVRILSAVSLMILSVLVLVAADPTTASAKPSIQPDQHFVGRVNGRHRDPIVYTVCPGPSSPGRTGHPAAGQKMVVRKKAAGHGETGLFGQVYAWFVPTAGGAAPTQLLFETYGSRQAIPTSLAVPCDGAGQVEFSSCPYLAPCAAGWVPDYVNVRFVNISP
jgi:hypothetical protein